MVDILKALRSIAVIAAIIGLYSIAAGPGIAGKALVGFIIIIAGWYYFREQGKKRIVNPVTEYYQRLLTLCHLNCAPNLRFLMMAGDKHNQSLVKGIITGGPVNLKNKALLSKTVQTPEYLKDDSGELIRDKKGLPSIQQDKDGNPVMVSEQVPRVIPFGEKLKPTDVPDEYHVKDQEGKTVGFFDPRADSFVFAYTPNFGGLYDLPLIGWIMKKFFRQEYLFKIHKSQLREQTIYGDIIVKGISTTFVGMLEMVNDWQANPNIEMAVLEREVDQITLMDNLSQLPTRIRFAVDSSSTHTRLLDVRDELLGGR